jgi:hypothetical protein
VRGRLGYSGGEVAEAGARVNGEETGWAVVSGDRAGEGMGGTRDQTSRPGLSAGEWRERERGGAADRWGRAIRRAGAGVARLLGPREEEGGKRARLGLDTAQPRGRVFSFFFFYFLFLISIFYFYFLFISFSFEQQLAK